MRYGKKGFNQALKDVLELLPPPNMKKEKKLYAVINPEWMKDGWEDMFYEQMMAIRCEQIFGLAIFNDRSEAEKFKKVGNRRKDKIIEVKITPNV